MKKAMSFLLIMVILLTNLTIPPATAAQTDLLSDGGFESGLLDVGNEWKFTGGTNSWYKCGTASIATGTVYEGTNSVEIFNGAIGQRVLLEAGKTYKLSAMLYPTATNVNGINMGFNDGTKTWPFSNPIQVVTNINIDWANSWKEYSILYECDRTQEFVVGIFVAGQACKTWVDNFSLVEVKEETENPVEESLVRDGGLESGQLNTMNEWLFTGGDNNKWYKAGTVSVVTDPVYEGSNSAYLSGGALGQRVTLEAGKTYKLSAMLYPTVMNANGINMGFNDGTKTWPFSNPLKVVTNINIDWVNSWKEYSVTYECDRTQEFVVGIYVDQQAGGTWVDNFSLVEVEIPVEESLVRDGGLESAQLNTVNEWRFIGGDNDKWYKAGTVSIATNPVYEGSYSAYLFGGAIGQRVTLEAGKKYKFSVQMYPTAFYAGGITMGFYDGTKQYPMSNAVKAVDVKIDWTESFAEYSVIYECNKTQEYIVAIYVDGSACKTWVDNFKLIETSEDEGSISTNPEINVDYEIVNGEYNKSKLLNVSRGGYFLNRNRYWMPSYYDKLEEDGINMVRMDWVLTDEYYHIVSRDSNGELQYDFTLLDEVVLPLLDRGITPFMCMTGIPEALGGTIEPPWGFVGRTWGGVSNLTEYGEVIAAVVQHYRDLGYTGWYWESHNEPESGEWGSAYQVSQQYGAFAKAVKAVDPTAKVGGIGFRNGDVNKDASWKTTFFTYLRNNPDVPIDYISIHEYNMVTTFTSGNQYQDMAAGYGRPNLPIIYSEYNYDWSVFNVGSVKDTNVNAAYISKRLFSALSQDNVDYVFYFTPSDAHGPTVLLNGDSGMYTVNGHRKAVSNAFNMLGDMEIEMLSTTEDIYTQKNRMTAGFATKNSLTKRVTMFAFNYTNAEAEMEIAAANLPYTDSNVKITIREVSETSGNYAADYLAGYGGYSETPNERPREKVEVIAPTSEYAKNILMPRYSVFEIILEPTDESVTSVYTKQSSPVDINLAFRQPVTTNSEGENGGLNRAEQIMYWKSGFLTDGQRLSFDMVNTYNESNYPAMGYRSAKFDSAAQNVWVCVDLGMARAIDQVKLSPVNDIENDGTGFPVDFKIQTSVNGQNWTDVYSASNYNGGAKVFGTQDFAFSTVNARYVRINVSRLSPVMDGFRLQLSEFEVIAAN